MTPPPTSTANSSNILLISPAVHAGYRTYFTTAADLAARCHRAATEGRSTIRTSAEPNGDGA